MNLASGVERGISYYTNGADCATEMPSELDERGFGALRACSTLTHPPSFEFDGYRIGVALTQSTLNEVRSLVHKMYSWRGYVTSVQEGTSAIAERITLKASTDEHIIGTLSVVLDSSHGLAADELYPDEISVFRNSGKRVCEFTRLAVDIEPRFDSKDFLARLIHVAFVYAHLIEHATDMVIEVNPRHVGFYRRWLGFSQIGPERICSRVDAPAVLMHIDLHYMATQIRVHGGGHRHGSERALYPHFLSGDEQRVLIKRMQHYMHQRNAAATPLLPRNSSGYPVQRLQLAEAQQPRGLSGT